MDGLKKFNKEKVQEQVECHILKQSQESSKIILKVLTDFIIPLFKPLFINLLIYIYLLKNYYL